MTATMTGSDHSVHVNVSGSGRIGGPVVGGIGNRVVQGGPADAAASEELARALDRLREIVLASGNADAVDNYQAMTEELQRDRPRASLLRSFWQGIRNALPTVTELVDLSAKLSSLLS